MKRIWLFALPAIALVGCNDRDETDVKLNTAVAYTSAREALSTAWNSVSSQAAKITASSSRTALEAAKKQAEHLKEELSKIEIKNPIDQAKLDAAQNQLEKVQAAMNLQELQKQSEDAVQKAIAAGQIAQMKYEDASRKLAEMDADYRGLKTKLDQAQQMYDTASAALAGAVERVKQAAG